MNINQEAKTSVLDGMSLKSTREAQGLVEYALIIVLVAIIVLVVLAILGPGVGNMFSNVMSNI